MCIVSWSSGCSWPGNTTTVYLMDLLHCGRCIWILGVHRHWLPSLRTELFTAVSNEKCKPYDFRTVVVLFGPKLPLRFVYKYIKLAGIFFCPLTQRAVWTHTTCWTYFFLKAVITVHSHLYNVTVLSTVGIKLLGHLQGQSARYWVIRGQCEKVQRGSKIYISAAVCAHV
jgi:hypothetical protein